MYACACDVSSHYYNISRLMHSASSRFNSVVVFTSTILVILCAINFAHGYYLVHPQLNNLEVRLALRDPVPFVDTKQWEQAAFRFDLYADLSPLYNWNLKQLFVFIEFEWTDPISNLTSRMTASDWILEVPEDKSKLKEVFTLNLTDAKVEYLVRDVYHNLRGTTVKASVNIEYMPIAGIFFNARLFQTSYTMPKEYSNADKK